MDDDLLRPPYDGAIEVPVLGAPVPHAPCDLSGEVVVRIGEPEASGAGSLLPVVDEHDDLTALVGNRAARKVVELRAVVPRVRVDLATARQRRVDVVAGVLGGLGERLGKEEALVAPRVPDDDVGHPCADELIHLTLPAIVAAGRLGRRGLLGRALRPLGGLAGLALDSAGGALSVTLGVPGPDPVATELLRVLDLLGGLARTLAVRTPVLAQICHLSEI